VYHCKLSATRQAYPTDKFPIHSRNLAFPTVAQHDPAFGIGAGRLQLCFWVASLCVVKCSLLDAVCLLHMIACLLCTSLPQFFKKIHPKTCAAIFGSLCWSEDWDDANSKLWESSLKLRSLNFLIWKSGCCSVCHSKLSATPQAYTWS